MRRPVRLLSRCLAAGTLLGVAVPALAQRADSLPVGARVRARLVYPPPGHVVGTLVGRDSATLTIAVAGERQPVVLRHDEVADLQRSIARLTAEEAFARGARRGALVGLGVSAVLVGFGLYTDYRAVNSASGVMASATLLTGAAGAAITATTTLIGGAIGRADPDRWTRVPLAPRVTPRVAPR